MEFPVYLTIGALKIHPHPVFESLAYFISLRLALRRFRQNPVAQRRLI
jgi:phosphatidylglycerol---prolipoprotein diacylglyceryl transferase